MAPYISACFLLFLPMDHANTDLEPTDLVERIELIARSR
jgi:hypothetical protein